MSGTKVGHAMAPSRKERISVVIYSRPQTTISREPQLRSVRARERAMSLWHGFHRHSSAAARTKYAMKFGNAARRVGHRNLWMRGIFGQGVTDHDRKQYRGHFESQMVCFRALGVQGRGNVRNFLTCFCPLPDRADGLVVDFDRPSDLPVRLRRVGSQNFFDQFALLLGRIGSGSIVIVELYRAISRLDTGLYV
jgi:hypothetical protein